MLPQDHSGIVTSMLTKGYDSYTWSKEKALKSKVLKPTLEPSLNFIEAKLSEAKKVYPVEKVVTGLDNRIDSALKYSQDTLQTVVAKPIELKNGTLTILHKNLDKLKTEEEEIEKKDSEEKSQDEGERSLLEIYTDVKVITSQRAQKILDASEKIVNKYLPENEEESEEVPKNSAYRAFYLSKVVTKRMQRRALSKLDQLKLRTQSVVHIDLVKYSNMLDLESKKAWLNSTTFVTAGKSAGKKVSSQISEVKKSAVEKTEKLRENVSSQFLVLKKTAANNVPKKIVDTWESVGESCDKLVVKPCEQIIDTFKQELQKQQEIVKNKEDDPNKPLTIEAGLRAVVAAARFRLKKEWEMRVAPTVDQVINFRSKSSKNEECMKEDDDISEESNESTEPLYDAQE